MKRLIRNKDCVSGLLIFLLAAWAFHSTGAFAQSSLSSYGSPAVVPRVVLTIIMGLAVLITLEGLRRAGAQGEHDTERKGNRLEKLPEPLTLALMIVYVIALKPVGYVIATTVYLCLQMYVLSCFDRRKIWQFLLIACVISPLLFYAFRSFFSVLLPAGILGWNP